VSLLVPLTPERITRPAHPIRQPSFPNLLLAGRGESSKKVGKARKKRRTSDPQIPIHPSRPQSTTVRLHTNLNEPSLLAARDGLDDEAGGVGVRSVGRASKEQVDDGGRGGMEREWGDEERAAEER
jgi:hypothetical protein